MKYRAKPIVVDAVPWWPPGHEGHIPENYPTLLSGPEWAHRCRAMESGASLAEVVKPGAIWWVGAGETTWAMYTLEGNLDLSPGDMIITGVMGERRPCKPENFAASYDPAEGEEAEPEWGTEAHERWKRDRKADRDREAGTGGAS